MNKLVIAALLGVAALIAATMALPWLISSEAVRASLHQRAIEITGRQMTFNGDPKVALSPFLGIEINDVAFKGGPDGRTNLLTIPTLRAKLSVTSALRGKVQISEFQFVRPQFDLRILPNGKTNWAFGDGEVWQVLQEAKRVRDQTETGKAPDLSQVSDVPLGRFSVLDGIITYEDLQNGRKETVSNLSGTLSWPSTRSAWKFDGSGIWRGDQVAFSLGASTPIMLLAGGSSPIVADIKSEPMTLTFKGEANRFSDFFVAGNVTARSPSLRRTINFFGGDTGTGASFSNFQAAGKIAGTLRDLQLSAGTFSLDGNTYSGSLRLGSGEGAERRLSGTLASQSLDLSPYTASIGTPDGILSLSRIVNRTEMDIRLSAKSVGIGDAKISDFAGSVISRKGEFSLDIGNAAIGGGLAVGKLTAALEGEEAVLATKVNLSGINLSAVDAFKQFGALSPSGIANLDVDMRSKASAEESFGNNVDGIFSLRMENGLLRGVDFSQLRPSLEAPVEGSSRVEIGGALAQTPVREFILNANVNHGVAWIGDSSFLIDDYRSRISGKADLRSGNLAIWGLMQKQDENADWRSHSQYFLGGTLTEPLYVPQFTVGTSDMPGDREPQADKSGETN